MPVHKLFPEAQMSKIESFFLAENPLRSAYLSTMKRLGLNDYSFFLENNYVATARATRRKKVQHRELLELFL